MSRSKKVIRKLKKLQRYMGVEANTHVWQFARVGGVNRVNLERGQDLLALDQLDQKLWTALSCPVHGLEIDARTLELIDADHDDRIRVPEVLEAVKWICSVIKNPDDLLKGSDVLPLSAINDETPGGKDLLESARQILKNLGKPDAIEITAGDTSDIVRIFADTRFNGDGIITPESTDDDGLKTVIMEVINCVGSLTDRNGKPGVGQEQVDEFFTQCEDFSQWMARAEAEPDRLLPYAENTAEAFAAFLAVQRKLDDYFLRCRLADYDQSSLAVLNSLDTFYEGLRTRELSACTEEIAGFPLTKIETGKPFSLKTGINPAWAMVLDEFYQKVVLPLFPEHDSLTESEWKQISANFDPYRDWQGGKAGSAVEPLGLPRVRELVAAPFRARLQSLIEQDLALAEKSGNIMRVDQLVRYYRDLYKLLNNYVTFYDFYSPGGKAVFQAGSLYIDQRRCDLCIRVSDMPKHELIAKTSGICLIYCDCFSKTRNEKMTIVAALTNGDFDNIDVGRNAIFYDRKGNDWDATIVKVIEHPISIRQAFWSPYRKFSKFVSKQIEKMAASKEKAIEDSAAAKVEATSTKVDAGLTTSVKGNGDALAPPATPPAATVPAAAPAPPPFDIGKFVGIFAAISLALGAIGSVIATMLTGFFSLTWWKMPLAILGVMLCISGPSMILAWLKLRKRNLAPILDANGWAVNARAIVNIPFGNTLTHLAELPENSRLNLIDPFAKKKDPVVPILIVTLVLLVGAALLLWKLGFLSRWGIW